MFNAGASVTDGKYKDFVTCDGRDMSGEDFLFSPKYSLPAMVNRINAAYWSTSPASRLLQVLRVSTGTRSLVGAGLPAMVVNDNAYKPDKRGALESIASKPALTGIACFDQDAVPCRSCDAASGRFAEPATDPIQGLSQLPTLPYQWNGKM
ncbi:hypothetical protein [Pseudomonas sp. A-R-19]|uniref:hypothetical protein n=1 Tax=Pseudomonas sp. A-R-19 TaxID=2832403 RepID=UPI001CBB1865|nr:hypothetical protein [Pseudomonas sp. A-R-19]